MGLDGPQSLPRIREIACASSTRQTLACYEKRWNSSFTDHDGCIGLRSTPIT